MSVLSDELLDTIRQSADPGRWPEPAFGALAGTDVLRWSVPVEYGGVDVDDRTFTEAYIELADADLSACFVLTQRNGAVQRIASSDNETARAELLPALVAGQAFATVAISHLTTSRQHTAPAMRAERTDGGYRLGGTCPWATSATRADILVTGGQLDDETQLLAAVEAASSGSKVVPGEPMTLHALSNSETGTVDLRDVFVPASRILAGPVEAVMRQGKGGGAGSLTTTALAVGLSQRTIRLLTEEAANRPDLATTIQPLAESFTTLRSQLLAAAAGDDDVPAGELRQRANSLALRSTQALLTATKGAGFMVGHAAELAVREAMFFLVWSCPRDVAEAAMASFACEPSL